YHGQSWLERLVDLPTLALNARDGIYLLIGLVQCWLLLGKIRPDAILLKGGFVGVPVGLAAAARKLPFVTHDSDAIPGLANRLVSRWARMHAVALPPAEYPYPPGSTVQVGVLVEPNFRPINPEQQAIYKQRLELPPLLPVLLITGSSSGAQRLNEAAVTIVDKLLTDYPDLHIVHQTGKGKLEVYGPYRHARLQVIEFMRPMYVYTGAADVVVARASANTAAELGIQGKAVVLVPNPQLAEGHQLKNAERLLAQNAVLCVPENAHATDALALDNAIRTLLNDPTQRQALATQLQRITIADAAYKLAYILLDIANKGAKIRTRL
ncbi:MAG TPA: UDP-N-acetylglucosamine--N-acetylmuramyl-(pentapeptide) pyrophosphoryl-undecaprenol N-acetylglucosamine transferase, partial [Hymenobacter sp.]